MMRLILKQMVVSGCAWVAVLGAPGSQSVAAPIEDQAQRQACRQLDGEACSKLAWTARREGRKQEAMADFRRACYRGFPQACEHFATLASALGDQQLATEGLEEACRHRQGDSCQMLTMQENKQNTPERACRRGAAAACLAAAVRAQASGDTIAASSWRAKACDMGAAAECITLADRATSRRLEVEATNWRRKACQAGDKQSCCQLGKSSQNACVNLEGLGCFRLAERVRESCGLSRESAELRQLYGAACKQGEALACDRLPPVARPPADTTCATKPVAECEEQLRGIVNDGSLAARLEMANNLCGRRSMFACTSLAEHFLRVGAASQATGYLRSACALGASDACVKLSAREPTADISKTLVASCDGGHGKSCYHLGVQAQKGGRAPDAKRFFQKACKFGYGIDCDETGPAH